MGLRVRTLCLLYHCVGINHVGWVRLRCITRNGQMCCRRVAHGEGWGWVRKVLFWSMLIMNSRIIIWINRVLSWQFGMSILRTALPFWVPRGPRWWRGHTGVKHWGPILLCCPRGGRDWAPMMLQTRNWGFRSGHSLFWPASIVLLGLHGSCASEWVA